MGRIYDDVRYRNMTNEADTPQKEDLLATLCNIAQKISDTLDEIREKLNELD